MKRWITYIIIFVISLIKVISADESVYIPDAVLKAAIEDTLSVNDPTDTDMLALETLIHVRKRSTQDGGIRELTGLEYAHNLEELNLRFNRIQDIGPLADLSHLQNIDLSQNDIRNLSPLSGLHNLEFLNMHGNKIRDLTPLMGLSNLHVLILRLNPIITTLPLSTLHNLEHLDLWGSYLENVSGLGDLSHLGVLDLRYNYRLSDLKGLGHLEELAVLYLEGNNVSDLSELLSNTHLRYLGLNKNPLNNAAYCSDLQAIVNNNSSLDLGYDQSLSAPAEVYASDGLFPDKVRVTWTEVCNGPIYTSYYRVYRSLSVEGSPEAISDWQSERLFDDTSAEVGTTYVYWVQTGDSPYGQSVGPYSQPDTGTCLNQVSLALTSTAGGSVTIPGEGIHFLDPEAVVHVQAEPVDVSLYTFTHWSGSAVEAELLADINQPSITLTLNDSYTLRAHFISSLTTIHVDDNASYDPNPGDADQSDPQEMGSLLHPFDQIQEAIEIAPQGSVIRVHSGSYVEKIDLLGKQIQLLGFDANDPYAPFPIIDGNDHDTVVTCTQNEDSSCLLQGFVITRGKGSKGAAVYCRNSNPTFLNCLIVGNRALDPNGAVIYCMNSSASFFNCTISNNAAGTQGACLSLYDSRITLANSILWDNSPLEVWVEADSALYASYSDINITDDSQGMGNLYINPLFAQPGYWLDSRNTEQQTTPDDPCAIWVAGDYHLKSQMGRWEPALLTWVKDSMTSPCVDAGDPSYPVGPELFPHGDIINIGVYGMTATASKSLQGTGNESD